MTRKATLCDAESEARRFEKMRVERSEGIPSRARSVTCTGQRATCGTRGRCGGLGHVATSFRPARARAPPQRAGAGSSS